MVILNRASVDSTEDLIGALKARLRAQGIVYSQLAKKVGLSEASVKRIMASGQMTLAQLDKLCLAAQTTVLDLAHDAAENTRMRRDQHRLTDEQDLLLASDSGLFHFYFSLTLKGDLESATQAAGFSPAQRTRALVALDRWGLIELHEHDRVVLQVPNSAQWPADGALMKKYGVKIREHFFNHKFDQDAEFMSFRSVRISRDSAAMIRQRLVQISQDIETAHRRESHHSDSESFAAVMSIRSWSNPILSEV